MADSAADQVVIRHGVVDVVVALLRVEPHLWVHVRVPAAIRAVPSGVIRGATQRPLSLRGPGDAEGVRDLGGLGDVHEPQASAPV